RTGEVDMNEVHPYVTEGIGEDFVPQNYEMQYIDAFEQVTDKDAAVMTRRLAKEEGIFCGYSAGTAIQGLLQMKDQLKKDDMVVVILHDHGSRYVAKIYNDQWMMERGYLDVKTFKDLVNARSTKQKLVTIAPKHTVAEAVELMKKYDIEHIPVVNGNGPIGSISENGLFQKVFSNPDIKNESVENVMEHSFPIVDFDTPVERLSTLINKENGAVLSKDETGNFHIVTKYDVIQALGS
ncbi:MAG: pyridoxal-phosphate dependent enzyme, partial [Flavitalea sp.]